MEYKLDELLHNLHKYLFADAEQIITELRHYCLDRSHQEAELGTSLSLFEVTHSQANSLHKFKDI